MMILSSCHATSQLSRGVWHTERVKVLEETGNPGEGNRRRSVVTGPCGEGHCGNQQLSCPRTGVSHYVFACLSPSQPHRQPASLSPHRREAQDRRTCSLADQRCSASSCRLQEVAFPCSRPREQQQSSNSVRLHFLRVLQAVKVIAASSAVLSRVS